MHYAVSISGILWHYSTFNIVWPFYKPLFCDSFLYLGLIKYKVSTLEQVWGCLCYNMCFFKDHLDSMDGQVWRGYLVTPDHLQPGQRWEAFFSPAIVRPQQFLPVQKEQSHSIVGSLFFLYKETNKLMDKTWVMSQFQVPTHCTI